VTTLEPGARVVLTHGLDVRPFLLALRASRPAASMTEGLDVLVHDVIAAIATAPWSSVKLSPFARVTAEGSSCEVKPTGSDAGNVPSRAASISEWPVSA
jgi:hypothetical protein